MKEYIGLILFIIILPVIYTLVLQWHKVRFEEEANKNRKLLRSPLEYVVLAFSEAALIRIWFLYRTDNLSNVMFLLLYMVLIFMTVFCMTDLWEHVVPNRILLLMILAGFCIIAYFAIRESNTVVHLLLSMILGILFCIITFGVTYIISKGSLGSGDVKLAILLGIFLTSEYVVGTVFYGCVISALYSIVQLIRKKVTRKDELPFVPFMYIGLVITYFIG